MRQDFDFVTMDDYRSDMDEQTKLGVNVISKLRADAYRQRWYLWLLINAAGGELSFHDNDILNNDPKDCELVFEYNASEGKFIATAKKA